jgi:hypothetical protein
LYLLAWQVLHQLSPIPISLCCSYFSNRVSLLHPDLPGLGSILFTLLE